MDVSNWFPKSAGYEFSRGTARKIGPRGSAFSAPFALHLPVVMVLTLGLAAGASANETGVVGASGKNQGFFCRNCHGGGVFPTVALDGPIAVDPGATGAFSFTVTSNAPAEQVAAGFNVAASDGVLAVDDEALRVEVGELTHNEPRSNDSAGEAVFEFTWQAPSTAGVYTLFGAGTSVNLDVLRTGDAAAATTLEVFVGVEPPTPTPAPPTPTATATPASVACVGDCDLGGDVTVDEVITGVSMALGVLPVSTCLVFDGSGDGQVTVDEILQAVNSALSGCP